MEEKKNEKANKIVTVLFLVTLLLAIVMSVVLIIVMLFRGGSRSGGASDGTAAEVYDTAASSVDESEPPRYTPEQMAVLDEAERNYAQIQSSFETKSYSLLDSYLEQYTWYEDVEELKAAYYGKAEQLAIQDYVVNMISDSDSELDGYSVGILCTYLTKLNGDEVFQDTCDKGIELLKKLADEQYALGSYETAKKAYDCLNTLVGGEFGAKSIEAGEKEAAIVGEFSGKKYTINTMFMEDGLYLVFTPKKGEKITTYANIWNGEWKMYFDTNYDVSIEDAQIVVSSTGGMFDGEYKRK